MNKITLIGAGNMGAALYRGLVSQWSPEMVVVCDTHPSKLEAMHAATTTTTSTREAAREADVAILAVKPASLKSVFDAIGDALSNTLVVSVMAGVTLERLEQSTSAQRIIRAMPNLPAQIDEGVVAWMASDGATAIDKALAERLFGALGVHLEVQSEDLIDAATAISGSGPAYFFFLCELLAEKAVELGFSTQEARLLAEQTCVGAGKLLSQHPTSAKEWRQAVTSKGGTTEAALSVLGDGDFSRIFFNAVDAAYQRSKELVLS